MASPGNDKPPQPSSATAQPENDEGEITPDNGDVETGTRPPPLMTLSEPKPTPTPISATSVALNDASTSAPTMMKKGKSQFQSLAPRMARSARKQRRAQRTLMDARVAYLKAAAAVDSRDKSIKAPTEITRNETAAGSTSTEAENEGNLEDLKERAERRLDQCKEAERNELRSMLDFLMETHEEVEVSENPQSVRTIDSETLDGKLNTAFEQIRKAKDIVTCQRCRGRFFAREKAASWPVFCRGASLSSRGKDSDAPSAAASKRRKMLTKEDWKVERDVTKAHELRCALRGERKTERNDERAIVLYKGALRQIDGIEERAKSQGPEAVEAEPGGDLGTPGTEASKLKSQVLFCLGLMTQQGLGCPRDLPLAEMYYQESTTLDRAIAGALVNHGMILEEYADEIENDAVLGVHGSQWRWWSRELWWALLCFVVAPFKVIYDVFSLLMCVCTRLTCCCANRHCGDGGNGSGDERLFRQMSKATRTAHAKAGEASCNSGPHQDGGVKPATPAPSSSRARHGEDATSNHGARTGSNDSKPPKVIECLSDTIKDYAIKKAKMERARIAAEKAERNRAKPGQCATIKTALNLFMAGVTWVLASVRRGWHTYFVKYVASSSMCRDLDDLERRLYASHLREWARILTSEALHTCLENAERDDVEEADKGWNLAMAAKILLSGKADVRNEKLAFDLCKCASKYQSSFGEYMLGEMYLYGTGTRRNVHKAVEHLQLSGGMGFRAGFYQLGVLYEFGMGGGGAGGGGLEVPKDGDQALLYYEQAASRQKPRQDQEHALEATILTSRLTQSANLDTIDDTLGNAVGSLLSWALAGQAFLFSAAAEFSGSAQVDHYATLLFFLPFVGIVLAINMLLSGIVTSRRNYHRRIGPFKLYLAKRRAHDRVLRRYEAENIGDEDILRGTLMGLWDVVRYLFFLHPNTVRPCSEHEGSGGRRVEILFHLQTFFEYANVILSLVFLIAWAVLFAGEIVSRGQGCSDWWTNACVDNEVFCNVEFQKDYRCSHDASAPSPAPDSDVEL